MAIILLRKGEGASWGFLYEGPNPFTRPTHFPEASPPRTITLGLGFHHMDLGGQRILVESKTNFWSMNGIPAFQVPASVCLFKLISCPISQQNFTAHCSLITPFSQYLEYTGCFQTAHLAPTIWNVLSFLFSVTFPIMLQNSIKAPHSLKKKSAFTRKS